MIGSIGFDMQGTRAAACLLEWGGPEHAIGRGALRHGVIGDGRRLLIPVAATTAAAPGAGGAADGLWGSAAAEAVLARARPCDGGIASAAANAAALAGLLNEWRGDPWNLAFLTGLRGRVLRYLGQPLTGSVHSHVLSCSADPGPSGDWPRARQALDEAGLGDTELVRPADALLCRWLSGNPDLSRNRTVLAVACGETATDLVPYTVQGAQEAVARLDQKRVDAGSDPWLADLAVTVLRLCRPDIPARGLLSVLDGADEFAAALRATPADAWAEWSGPLSQHMFDPYRARRAELAARPSVAGWTMPVAEAARRLVHGSPGPVTVLVGGPGAAWPFIRDLLAATLGGTSLDAAAPDGGVWVSGDPALDLAFGACWWPLFKRTFDRVPTRSMPSRPSGLRIEAGTTASASAGAAPWAGGAAPWAEDAGADPPPWETTRSRQAQTADEPAPWER